MPAVCRRSVLFLASKLPKYTFSGASRFSGHARAEGAEPKEAEPIELVRSRIFGSHIGEGALRSGRKVLRRSLIGEKVANYYPPKWFAGDPLLMDIEAERKSAKLQRLSRRGKSPPKKGAGKRSGKK
jgi:small subunit ribosomal protein S33